MRRTGLARGQGMKLAVSSEPKERKVFVPPPQAGRRALLGAQAVHLPCAKWSFWWVSFREQSWVTSRERRSVAKAPRTSLQGYKVIPACDGKDALQKARAFDGIIHMLLSDVEMPGMTGIELAIQLNRERPETKIH